MKVFLEFIIFIYLGTLSNGLTYNYDMTDYCTGYVVQTLDDEDVLYLHYNGDSLTAPTCSIGVGGLHPTDKYIICAYVDSFHFDDCGLHLELAEEVDRFQKNFSCGDSGATFSTYCTLEEKNLHVVLQGETKGNNSFTLRILAQKTYNHSAHIALIIGLCVAGVVVVVVIIIVAVFLIRRRRKRYAMDEDANDTLMNLPANSEIKEVKSDKTSSPDKPGEQETQSLKEKETTEEPTEKDESKPIVEATTG